MKKIIPILALPLLLTGCSDNTELGDRAIIQAAAIDFDRGEYNVSALLFSSGGGSGDTIDASQDNVIKVSGSGKTLAEAIDNISLIDGKEIYMSETKLLILGGGFSDVSALPALNTLYYDMRCSLNMPICFSEDAELLTDLHFKEGITAAEKPLSMIEYAYDSGNYPKAVLLDVFADSSGGRATLIPAFEETENGYGMTDDEEGKTAVLSGSCYMMNGRLSAPFDSRMTAGLMLLSGLTDKITLNYTVEGDDENEYTCEAYCIKAELLPDKEDMVRVSARFRERNGAALSEKQCGFALAALTELVRGAMKPV